MIFRRAETDDIGDIARIYEKIHREEESGRTTIGWLRGVYPTRKTAEESLEKGTLFVEEDNKGTIVAAAKIDCEQVDVYALCPWTIQAPRNQVLVLHTLVVDPDKGGLGYGKAFVLYYEQMAEQLGCKALRLDTNERNERARKMYAKMGYGEVATVPTTFNGIANVRLICMEKLCMCQGIGLPLDKP